MGPLFPMFKSSGVKHPYLGINLEIYGNDY